MTVREAIRSSLNLLAKRDRKLLVLITAAQMSTAFLDLVGILMIGLVTALSLSVMSSIPQPAVVQRALEASGLDSADTVMVALTLAVAAGVLLITKSALNMFLTKRILRFLANRQALVSGRLAAGLLSRPLLQVQQRSSQETVYSLTSGVSAATIMILGQGTIALSEIALLVILAIGMLVISPIVTIFTVVFFVAIGLTLHKGLSARAGRVGQRSANIEIQNVALIQEALRTYREAVVSQRRGLYVRRFQELCWQGAVNQTELQFVSLIPKYVLEIALVCGAGLLAASQLLTKDLNAAVAIIAVFLAAGSRIVPSILRLQIAAISIRSSSGQAVPTYQLADELDEAKLTSATSESFGSTDPATILSQLKKGHGGFEASIVISGVHVTYPGATNTALSEVSLSLPAGASMAFVGSTGAGKSTLADLILGVLIPDSGSALIGGMPPAEALATWPGAVAYVPQDVAMTNGTVRDNVALGLPSEIVDDEWVWEALNRAHLGDFLRGSRDGLETVVGEHGVQLSGGQRQRLGIARALYTRPKLLVLDEATSALDAETEQAIAKTLQDLEGTVTTVTIAHRLATIRHCDLVVYLEGGRIHAQGTFDEVRAIARPFDMQAKLLGL
jgi:ABC-type multidrug transport system fused ATPase/permease subunit